jgi:hypothetical protein
MENETQTTNGQFKDSATNYNEISYGQLRLAASPLTPILEAYRLRNTGEENGRVRPDS